MLGSCKFYCGFSYLSYYIKFIIVYIILDKLLNSSRLVCIGLVKKVCVMFDVVVDIININSNILLLNVCFIFVFNVFY